MDHRPDVPFITWADHVFGIVESPRGTGYLLLAILAGAIVMSLFFERRAFCSHLCFLGLSGNYSMTAPIAFRANQENCKEVGCKDLWCGNCVKSCPHGSLRLEMRKPTSEFWNICKPRLDVAFLAIVLVGVVIVQNMTMAGIAATVSAAYRIATSKPGRTGWRALIPQLMLIALLLAINIYTFSQPMAHRA